MTTIKTTTPSGEKTVIQCDGLSNLTSEFLASIGGHFAILIDAHDTSPLADPDLTSLITRLLDADCLYFVCAGVGSETLHDRIDDEIVARDLENIMTTYHATDTVAEVASYFVGCASAEVELLVAVAPKQGELWRAVEHASRSAGL